MIRTYRVRGFIAVVPDGYVRCFFRPPVTTPDLHKAMTFSSEAQIRRTAETWGVDESSYDIHPFEATTRWELSARVPPETTFHQGDEA